MRLGRLHVSGPDVWPDHVLSYDMGNLLVGAIVQVRGWAVGFESQGRHGNPWLNVYLGWWCVELYWDHDRTFEEGEVA